MCRLMPSRISGQRKIAKTAESAWLRCETALLPELAPVLPVAIPVFEIAVFTDVVFVGYRKLGGEPLSHGTDDAAVARSAGAFLAALHAFPRERACDLVPTDFVA